MKKSNDRIMMYGETSESYNMNVHHVSQRQSFEEIRLGKEREEGGYDESERREGVV